jgi:uncharacterized protein YjbI with pentapeptide repeats
MPRKRSRPTTRLPEPRASAGLHQLPRRILTPDEGHRLLHEEIRGIVVTGELHGGRTAHACNVVEAVFDELTADSVDFNGCDFKDSSIRSSRFVNSTFNSSSLAYNTFLHSQFESCTFAHTDIQNCEFVETTFIGCDLRNLLIKTCIFSRCEFVECQTNNKLFETCRLIDSRFRATTLQVQTLAENFGLTKSDYNDALRSDREDMAHRTIAIEDLEGWLKTTSLQPLQKANIDYFINETFLGGSVHLDASLKLDAWSSTFRTAGSFVVTLSQWADFLLWAFERDRLTVHTIIALHSMTDSLLRMLAEADLNQHVVSTLNGTRLSLARVVDEYLTVLGELTSDWSPETGLVLLVEGHGSKDYYQRTLKPMFDRAPAQIESVVPHNSPWELTLTFASASTLMFFVAFLLATRTHIELSRIRERPRAKAHGERALAPTGKLRAPARRAPNRIAPLTESILSMEFGGAQPSKVAPALRLKAYLPGNLIAEFKLTVGSRQLAKLRQTIKDML